MKLTREEEFALRELATFSEFAPERARRVLFHGLIDRGLARWLGYGLGGESFAITDAGRAVLQRG